MKVRARCNKRHCQARRNLSKHPEKYAKWPTCHILGCNGKMYVDKYRMRGGSKDHPPVCIDSCFPFPHSVDSAGCAYQEAYRLERFKKGRSKHSPIALEEPPF